MLNITPEVLHRAEEGKAHKIQHRTEYREVSRRFRLVSPSRHSSLRIMPWSNQLATAAGCQRRPTMGRPPVPRARPLGDVMVEVGEALEAPLPRVCALFFKSRAKQ